MSCNSDISDHPFCLCLFHGLDSTIPGKDFLQLILSLDIVQLPATGLACDSPASVLPTVTEATAANPVPRKFLRLIFILLLFMIVYF
jgi:hypothetical protein